MNKLFLLILFLGFCGASMAQDTRNAEVRKPPRPQYQAAKKEKRGLFFFLKKKDKASVKKTNQEEIEDFRSRMNQVYKEKAKVEKMANKKRYKEHGYFGHKRPPKKRPPHKQKFCKVCKIKH